MAETLDRDAQIITEARKQREHEQQMARIMSDKHDREMREVTHRRKSRHEMLGWITGIAGVVAVVLTLILVIANASSEDRAKELKIREQQNRVAETCIRDKNIWMDGNCIPATRS